MTGSGAVLGLSRGKARSQSGRNCPLAQVQTTALWLLGSAALIAQLERGVSANLGSAIAIGPPHKSEKEPNLNSEQAYYRTYLTFAKSLKFFDQPGSSSFKDISYLIPNRFLEIA
jgi:hypothetical protein